MRLTARALGHAFPGRPTLFSGIDFDLVAGDIAALTGPSGSGKSTVLSILAGWTSPTEGTLIRDGIDRVSWIPQTPFGVAERTVLDHVVIPLLATGATRPEAMRSGVSVLERFGLHDVASSRFGEVSGGEAQRLMLARASLGSSALLAVDEPTAQLDPTSAAAVIASLGELADTGRVVVIATHDPRVAASAGQVIDLGAR